MAVILRDYQERAKQEVRMAMRKHRSVLLEMATGAGKTVTFASITADVAARGKSIYLIAHRIELIKQISSALMRAGLPHGIIAPDFPTSSKPVQVAMVGTLANRLQRYPKPDLLVIDEAHHAIAGTYRKITDHWDTYRLGVSATPARLDGRGLGDVFDVMVHGPSMNELMDRGYLSRFNYFAPPQMVELSGVKARGGDYAIDQLEDAVDRASVHGDAIKHYNKHLDGRPAIVFCISVAHAEHVAAAFRDAGWKAASVDGSMDPSVRASRIAAIGNGGLNVLTSCAIISEGTDIPVVAGAILLRPTMSICVYLQQVGRVLRPKPDGSRAVILDHVGNVHRHGMPNAPRLWTLDSKPVKPQAVAVRTCPKCFAVFPPAPSCPECGYSMMESGANKRKLEQVDGDLAEMTVNDYLATAPLKELLRTAHSLEALQAIARARNYKPAWVRHQLEFKRQARERYQTGKVMA